LSFYFSFLDWCVFSFHFPQIPLIFLFFFWSPISDWFILLFAFPQIPLMSLFSLQFCFLVGAFCSFPTTQKPGEQNKKIPPSPSDRGVELWGRQWYPTRYHGPITRNPGKIRSRTGGVRGWVRGYGGVGLWVVGCGKQVLGVRAAKTTIERV
jgi:hypothetical protein